MHYPYGSWPRGQPLDYEIDTSIEKRHRHDKPSLVNYPWRMETGIVGILGFFALMWLVASPAIIVVVLPGTWPLYAAGIAIIAYISLWRIAYARWVASISDAEDDSADL